MRDAEPLDDLRAGDDFFLFDAFRAAVLAAAGLATLRLAVRFDDFEERAALLRLEAPPLRAADAPAFFELFLAFFEPALFRDFREAGFAFERLAGLFLAELFFFAAPFFAPPPLFLELDDLADFLLPLFFEDAFFAADFFAAIGVLLIQNLSVGEPYVFEIRDRAAWQLGCTKPM